MTIRVVRNDAGNCVNFFGTSNPTYWNACLEAEIDETFPTRINVINKIRSEEVGEDVYEFYQIPYTEWADKDGNTFESPSEAAEYITLNANVSGNVGTFIFSQGDTLDAQREATNTTVLFSNGDIYAVNALRAVAAEDGTITIRTIRGDKKIYTHVRYYNVTVNDGAVSFNTVNAAVDRLNEVLSGSTVGIDGGSASGGIATAPSLTTFDVYGPRLVESGSGPTAGYTSTSDVVNGVTNFDTSNGVLSTESISEAGEYFEFSQYQGDWSDTVGLTFGLFDETTYDRADLEVDEPGNAVKAVLRLRVKNTPFVFKDPASTFGRLNEQGFTNQVDTRTVFRVGLDADRRGYISMQLEDSTFQVITRTETAITVGTELKFVAIFPLANTMNGVRGMTVNKVSTAPELTWNYIESPDGSFYYPLFSTEEEANYVDEQYGTAATDAGQNHPHTFIDEQPTSQVWYMPSSYMFHDQSSAPAALSGVVYNEIATGEDANYVPTAFGSQSITINEGAAVNYAIVPAGDASSYNLTGIPAGLAFNGANLVGTAPEVAGDNVTTPTEDHVITVTKANDYGSSVGTLTITVNNLTAPVIPVSGTAHVSGSTDLIDTDSLDDGSVVGINNLLDVGNRLHVDRYFLTDNVLPALATQNSEKFFIGIPSDTADFSNGIDETDFLIGVMYQRSSASGIRSRLISNGAFTSNLLMSVADLLYWEIVIQNYGTEVEVGIAPMTWNPETIYSASTGSLWTSTTEATSLTSQSRQVVFGIQDGTMDYGTSGLTEMVNPVPNVNETSWTKALDFSGGGERAEMVNNGSVFNPMMMADKSVTVANRDDADARPWAAACVFKIDGNNSNQHIWNLGEGAGSTDDNIYLRVDASGGLYFGWGRQGSLNEHLIASNLGTANWYGCYVGHSGVRLSGSDATAANLAAQIQIKLLFYTGGNWDFDPNPQASGSGVWTTTGGRMDRQIGGALTVGGRGTNRNFHGQIASMVVTTLKRDANPFPSDAEIKEMVTDPIGWVRDYKEGETFRQSYQSTNTNWDSANESQKAAGTQIWLMGDGTNDSYSNMIRNQVSPTDQNYTKLNLLSMQSNDIVNVNIPGLS